MGLRNEKGKQGKKLKTTSAGERQTRPRYKKGASVCSDERGGGKREKQSPNRGVTSAGAFQKKKTICNRGSTPPNKVSEKKEKEESCRGCRTRVSTRVKGRGGQIWKKKMPAPQLRRAQRKKEKGLEGRQSDNTLAKKQGGGKKGRKRTGLPGGKR